LLQFIINISNIILSRVWSELGKSGIARKIDLITNITQFSIYNFRQFEIRKTARLVRNLNESVSTFSLYCCCSPAKH